MYRVRIVVEGTNRGLLMHKFSTKATAEVEAKVKRSTRQSTTPAEEAEDFAYRLDPKEGEEKGQLCLPAEHFLGSLIGAGSSLQVKGKGKKTYKDAFKGQVDIDPDYIPLTSVDGKPLHSYTIDSRPVRNPSTKGRIIRHRPHLQDWRAAFDVMVQDDHIPVEVLQAGLEEAGRSKCVGDYRPRFGSFRIVSCELMNGAAPHDEDTQD
jgi:hypothetical protein